MFRRKLKCALLIDFDNMVGVDHLSLDFARSIQNWLAWLEDGRFDPEGRRRDIVERRVYWNDQNRRWRQHFEAKGFLTYDCRSEVRGKASAADMMIALAAQAMAYENGKIDEFIILTTDTDFVPLLINLAILEKQTVAAANPNNLSFRVYSDHADFVISTMALKRALAYARPESWLRRRLAPAFAAFAALARAAQFLRNRALAALRRVGVGTPEPNFAEDREPEADRVGPVSNPSLHKLRRAADLLARVGSETPGLQLGRKTVVRILGRDEDLGFRLNGRDAYLGCGDYVSMLKRVAAQRQDLRFFRFGNGGVAISWRKAN